MESNQEHNPSTLINPLDAQELSNTAVKLHMLAVEKGWWDEPRDFGEVIANIHGEVSELWEAYRDGELALPTEKDVPLSKFEEEVADILIRVLDLYHGVRYGRVKGVTPAAANWPVGTAIRLKHLYNSTRPRRHGGKVA